MDSTQQLSQMVCAPLQISIVVPAHYKAERRICGDIWNPLGNLPKNEQHGVAAGVSMAMVHRISRDRLLVLHHCMVVSTVTWIVTIAVVLTSLHPLMDPHNHHTHAITQYRQQDIIITTGIALVKNNISITDKIQRPKSTFPFARLQNQSPKPSSAVGMEYPADRNQSALRL